MIIDGGAASDVDVVRSTLRDWVRREVDRERPEADDREVRRAVIEGLAQMGIFRVGVPPEDPTVDPGPDVLAVAAEELGTALVGAPLISWSVATELTRAATLALDPVADVLAARVVAKPGLQAGQLAFDDNSGRVYGQIDYVPDAAEASAFVGVLRGTSESLLLAVALDQPEVLRQARESLDLTRGLSNLQFDGAPAAVLARGSIADKAEQRALDLWRLLLAAESLGGIRAVLAMATDYARIRFAFGRPIGSFQAIKHQLAETWVALQVAESVVASAVTAVRTASESATALAGLAKAVATDTFEQAASRNVLVHGGIGFTWEHDAHRYVRRARSSQRTAGRNRELRAAAASLAGL